MNNRPIITYRNAIILLLVASFLWGLNGIFVRHISSLSAFGITAGRLLVAAIPLFLWVFLSDKTRQQFYQSLRDWPRFVLLGFILGLMFSCNSISYLSTYIANAQTLNSIGMFFVIVLGPVLLNEYVSKKDIVYMMIAFTGIIMVLGIDHISIDPTYFHGDLLALFASLATAFYATLLRKWHLRSPFPVTMLWIFSSAFVWVLIFGFIFHDPFVIGGIDSSSLMNLLGLGLLSTFIAHTILNITLTVVRAEKALTMSLLSGVWSYFLALIFLGETVQPSILVGLFITIAGVTGIMYSHYHESRQSHSSH